MINVYKWTAVAMWRLSVYKNTISMRKCFNITYSLNEIFFATTFKYVDQFCRCSYDVTFFFEFISFHLISVYQYATSRSL